MLIFFKKSFFPREINITPDLSGGKTKQNSIIPQEVTGQIVLIDGMDALLIFLITPPQVFK